MKMKFEVETLNEVLELAEKVSEAAIADGVQPLRHVELYKNKNCIVSVYFSDSAPAVGDSCIRFLDSYGKELVAVTFYAGRFDVREEVTNKELLQFKTASNEYLAKERKTKEELAEIQKSNAIVAAQNALKTLEAMIPDESARKEAVQEILAGK